MSILFFIKAAIISLAVLLVFFILGLVDMFLQLSRYQTYWNHQNEASHSLPGPVYIALGDSTAQGIGGSHPDKAYPSLIAKELVEREGQLRFVNLSKSGAKVKDVLTEQLPALENMQVRDAKYITIEIGANDMINFDEAGFEKDMDELMERLPPQAVMSDVPYFGGSRFASREANVRQANDIIYRLAEKHGREVASLHERVEKNSGLKTFAFDLFHPSDIGYRENWAPAFLERLPK